MGIIALVHIWVILFGESKPRHFPILRLLQFSLTRTAIRKYSQTNDVILLLLLLHPLPSDISLVGKLELVTFSPFLLRKKEYKYHLQNCLINRGTEIRGCLWVCICALARMCVCDFIACFSIVNRPNSTQQPPDKWSYGPNKRYWFFNYSKGSGDIENCQLKRISNL